MLAVLASGCGRIGFGGGGCAVDTMGRLYCWGEGAGGANGDGAHGSNFPTPVLAVQP